MTHKEFNKRFKEYMLPSVVSFFEKDGIPDKPARREEYNNYMDSLHRDGLITDKQVNKWCMPELLETCKIKKICQK